MPEERNNFKLYSSYYDLLYKDKDYKGEVEYLDRHIRQLDPRAGTLLNLGCGTGRHDYLLADLGYETSGVDLSSQMIKIALGKQTQGLPVSFYHGDARTVRLDKTFDVVTSLFHVFSYQISNQDLHDIFKTAHSHLKPGGHLLFDCWYGPGVLSDPPVVRIKRLENEELKITRIAEPIHHPNENVIDVNYELQFLNLASGRTESIRELHRMRYLFIPEVQLLARSTGFEILKFETWLTGEVPGLNTWNVLFLLKKV